MLFEKKGASTPDMDQLELNVLGHRSRGHLVLRHLLVLSQQFREQSRGCFVDDVIEVSAKDVTVAQDEYVTIKVWIGSDYEATPIVPDDRL